MVEFQRVRGECASAEADVADADSAGRPIGAEVIQHDADSAGRAVIRGGLAAAFGRCELRAVERGAV